MPPRPRLRGTSVQIARPMAQLIDDAGNQCVCEVQPQLTGVCTADGMRVTAADYESGRRLL